MNNLITKISSFLSTSLFFLSTPQLHSTTTRLFPSWLHKYACYIHFNLSRLIICYLTARDDKFGGVLLLPIRLPCGRPLRAKHWNAWTHWNVRTHKLKLCTLKTCTHALCTLKCARTQAEIVPIHTKNVHTRTEKGNACWKRAHEHNDSVHIRTLTRPPIVLLSPHTQTQDQTLNRSREELHYMPFIPTTDSLWWPR